MGDCAQNGVDLSSERVQREGAKSPAGSVQWNKGVLGQCERCRGMNKKPGDLFYDRQAFTIMTLNFEEEQTLWAQGYEYVAGLDEVGRGPLAGPVVAAACIMNSKHEIRSPKQIQNSNFENSKLVSDFDIRISDLQINDSKKLTEKKREELYEVLITHPDIVWGLGIVSEKEIDAINILQATKLAMKKALQGLSVQPDYLLIDGNFLLDFKDAAFAQGSGAPKQASIIKGDSKVFSIAAASIIAKVTRDRIMRQMHETYPQYGFEKHKGYGTAAHLAALAQFGLCDIHRKSFYPVSAMVK